MAKIPASKWSTAFCRLLDLSSAPTGTVSVARSDRKLGRDKLLSASEDMVPHASTLRSPV